MNSLEKRLNDAVSPAGGGWGWTFDKTKLRKKH
jgi:hypothetical protein